MNVFIDIAYTVDLQAISRHSNSNLLNKHNDEYYTFVSVTNLTWEAIVWYMYVPDAAAIRLHNIRYIILVHWQNILYEPSIIIYANKFYDRMLDNKYSMLAYF